MAAYFSQQGIELDTRGSVLDCAQRATGLKRPQAQNLLGRFLFSGWEMHERPAAALSGGERRRLTLAILVASGANFLVLDEPTNHLDVESREALEAALEAFPGTVLLVSHDRALLDAVADAHPRDRGAAVRDYEGGWADYARAVAERTACHGSEPPRRRRPGLLRPLEHRGAPRRQADRGSYRGKGGRMRDLERRLAETGRTSTPPLPIAVRARARRAARELGVPPRPSMA